MKKQMKLWCMVLAVVLCITGCAEHDTNYVADEEESSCKVEESVNLDEVYQPEKCSIYRVKKWEQSPETLLKAFSGKDEYKADRYKKTVYTNADSYEFKDEEKTTLQYLTGGDAAADYYSGGINYSTKESEDNFELLNEGDAGERWEKYMACDSAPDNAWEQIDISKEREKIQSICDEIGMSNYEPDYAIDSENGKKSGKSIVWRQTFDQIPVCLIALSAASANAGVAGKKIYNSSLSYDKKLEQKTGYMLTNFLNGKLISWFNYDAVTGLDKVGEKTIISCKEAYETAKHQAQKDLEAVIDKITLVKARLEYKLMEKDGEIYTCPVWNFNFYADLKEGENKYHVYLIDACSGEFFTGTDAALK